MLKLKITIMNISACGLVCDKCEFYEKMCNGCMVSAGKPFWTTHDDNPDICPLFNCSVNDRGYKNCGSCNELPCKMFLSLKDPNATEEQHHESMKKRIELLKN